MAWEGAGGHPGEGEGEEQEGGQQVGQSAGVEEGQAECEGQDEGVHSRAPPYSLYAAPRPQQIRDHGLSRSLLHIHHESLSYPFRMVLLAILN